MLEIKILGRGGQGIVTLGHILGHIALEIGLYATSIPRFGAERRGAPVHADVRINATPIKEKCFIESGFISIILDNHAFTIEEILKITKKGGFILLKGKEALADKQGRHFVCLDIAELELRGKMASSTNIAFLGGFCTLFGLEDMDLIADITQKYVISMDKDQIKNILDKSKRKIILPKSQKILPLELNKYVI